MQEYLMIADVVRPQGVRGECKIRSYAADISFFYRWHTLYRKTPEGFLPVSVRTERIRDGYVYAFLNDSSSADEAEKFRGTELYVDREHAAPAENGAVLIADLLGCEAWDNHGDFIGILSDVLQHGTVDTWVFKTGKGTLMAPALQAVFPEVDIRSRRIHVLREKLMEVAVWS